jgi:hypothetical protein
MKEISAESAGALQEKADEDTRQAIVDWAKETLPAEAGNVPSDVLKARVKAVHEWAKKLGMKTRREVALLFGVLLTVDPRLAKDADFRGSLNALREKQRCELLYDLLTGAPHPPLVNPGPLPDASDDWSKLLA